MPETGLVLVSYGASGAVELPGGARMACKYRRSVGRPYCGDRVEVEALDEGTVVATRILPRRNVFARADRRQRRQVIAANVDRVFVIVSPSPEPSRDLLQRYLVAAHSLEIEPLIVLNKAELADTASRDLAGPLGRLADYRKLGYEVLATSCKGPPGTNALLPHLEDRVGILAGQSGVGKSSLVNTVVPDLELQTGELSRITGKGTHTTTATTMYHLPSGGRLIDSPGVWEYELWEMSAAELAHGFIEFREHLGTCRFRNCRHAGEPGCAVRDAVREGEIRHWRYESYLRLLGISA